MPSPHNFPSSAPDPSPRSDLHIGYMSDTHKFNNEQHTRVNEELDSEQNLPRSSARTGYQHWDASIDHAPIVRPTHSRSTPSTLPPERPLQYTVAPERPTEWFPHPPGNFEGHRRQDGTIEWVPASRALMGPRRGGGDSHPRHLRPRYSRPQHNAYPRYNMNLPYMPTTHRYPRNEAPDRSESYLSHHHDSDHPAPLTYPSPSYARLASPNQQQRPVYSPQPVHSSHSATPVVSVSPSPPEPASASATAPSSHSDELILSHEEQSSSSQPTTPLQSSNDIVESNDPHTFTPNAGAQSRIYPWHEIDSFLRENCGIGPGRRADLWSVPDPVDPTNPDNDNVKPTLPLHRLAALAIHGSGRGMLTLEEIRKALTDRFAYYRRQDELYDKEAEKRAKAKKAMKEAKGRGENICEVDVRPVTRSWHDSLRHTLSLQGIFTQEDRPLTEQGKGQYWTLTTHGLVERYKRERKRKKKNAAPFVSLHQSLPITPIASGSGSTNTEEHMAVDTNEEMNGLPNQQEGTPTDNSSDRSDWRSDHTSSHGRAIRSKKGKSRMKSPYHIPDQHSSRFYTELESMGNRLPAWSMTSVRDNQPRFGQTSFPNVGTNFRWTGFPSGNGQAVVVASTGNASASASDSGSGSREAEDRTTPPPSENQSPEDQNSV